MMANKTFCSESHKYKHADAYKSIERRRMKRRRVKLIKHVLAWIPVIVLVIWAIWQLESIKTMQTDTLNVLNEVDVAVTYAAEVPVYDEYTLTAYCPCELCCNKTDGITATGAQAIQGRTIAVDPALIPLGSTVEINGICYIAEDVGGMIKGNHIDIFMQSHEDALKFGRQKGQVRVI